ncbi:MAG: ABC transporter ATP-binding protein [Clostridiales bacterium]|nr:ABC transporter ATP-binding protein [Clostridiales bacterium]
MLRVSGLTKKFGKKIANDNVSLSLDGGEIGVLLGPNGAGKSTVIKCILGLFRYEGEVTIGGFPGRSEKAKRILGYVPEFPSLYEMLTVTEQFEFIIRAYKLDRIKTHKYADELMKRFRLSEMKDTLCKDLSKGMQQKVSIICALLPRPKLLLLDEPMLGLDPYAIKELRLMVTELAESGVAVLISTHMISTVEGIWGKAYIMSKGHVISCHKKEEMVGIWAESLERIFFAETESYDLDDTWVQEMAEAASAQRAAAANAPKSSKNDAKSQNAKKGAGNAASKQQNWEDPDLAPVAKPSNTSKKSSVSAPKTSKKKNKKKK